MSAIRNSYRTRRRLVPLVLAVSAIAFACGGGGSESGGGANQPSTDFRLATLDGGKQLGPRDFGGQVVLLDFWATWCVPCHAQARILKSVYEELQRDGGKVQFLAVDVGEDAETVGRFVADNPFPYPVLIDPQDTLSYELGIVGLPTLMVVDRKGEVVYFEPGVIDGDALRRILADAGAA